MTLEINNLNEIIVKVNEGSGIILKFEADKKCYILTAYHNIKDSITHNESIELSSDEDEDESYSMIQSYFYEKNKSDYKDNDFAILEIEYIKKDIPIVEFENNIKPDDLITFMGYPDKANGDRKRLNGKVIEWNSKTVVNVTEEYIKGSFVDKEKTNEVIKGFSGSGVFKKDSQKLSLIGVLKSLNEEDFDYKDINCVPIEKISQFIEDKGLAKKTFSNPLISAWNNLSPKERNLNDKLKVCTNIRSARIKHYIRMVSIGKTEQSKYSPQDISTIKYMIWEKCQEGLMDFIDENKILTFDEIKTLFNDYSLRAKKTIKDKREEYKYGNFSDDIIDKIILDLIDECYLSFDEEGIYE